MKAAVLFSGQGQQFAEMGADFYQTEPIYRQTIDEANLQLDWDLCEPADWFENAERVPVAITAMNVGLYRLLTTVLPHPGVLSGLSLGEYGALIASGALSLNAGLKLVADRARYMQRASLQRPGQLVAALKVTPELVAAACQAAKRVGEAYPANYNLTDQIVIGGDLAGIQAATAYLKAHGIKRVVPLAVAVASHTPLMTSASEALAKRLQFVDVHVPQVPVISNTTVAPFTKATLKPTLVEQLVEPTHFSACLKRIEKYEVDTVIQIGPGNNLAKFAKQTLPGTTVWSIEHSDDWQALGQSIAEVHLYG
ncbi:ACP S-malonyltransferase [Lactiplantibacillus herbarum]|uniref:ACP S-malonyltransferase n=1 Tax=Lactiplantibacillus herbarum TaxID=1670446 RepID=UPI00064E9DBE|nr:ACP S-malonyltransferase [Lactiplantibacillus herbarum]